MDKRLPKYYGVVLNENLFESLISFKYHLYMGNTFKGSKFIDHQFKNYAPDKIIS